MSVIKEVVLLESLNFRVRDLIKFGYKHFKFDVTRASPRGIQIRAWKDDTRKGKFPCEGTKFNECDKGPFHSRSNLDLHQRAAKHGPYAVKPSEIILEGPHMPDEFKRALKSGGSPELTQNHEVTMKNARPLQADTTEPNLLTRRQQIPRGPESTEARS